MSRPLRFCSERSANGSTGGNRNNSREVKNLSSEYGVLTWASKKKEDAGRVVVFLFSRGSWFITEFFKTVVRNRYTPPLHPTAKSDREKRTLTRKRKRPAELTTGRFSVGFNFRIVVISVQLSEHCYSL